MSTSRMSTGPARVADGPCPSPEPTEGRQSRVHERERRTRLGERLREDAGTLTVLIIGVLVVILMVIGMGTAVTGVNLERNGLQHCADAAALAASQALDSDPLYAERTGRSVNPELARQRVVEYLRDSPDPSARLENLRIGEITVGADGTVTVELQAQTHPPLVGWFTRGARSPIPLRVVGEARAE